MNNPFLTNFNPVFVQARTLYLDTLARMQSGRKPPRAWFSAQMKTIESHLDQYWQAALTAAFQGDIQTARSQLSSIVESWALYKAFGDLLDANGVYLDPADPDTYNDIMRCIEHQTVFRATELQNSFLRGEQLRRNDQVERLAERQAELFGKYHQMYQQQGDALHQAHQRNILYADVAYRGIQQMQQGTQWMQQGILELNRQQQQGTQWMQQVVLNYGAQITAEALKTQQQATKMVEQNLPREIEKAQLRGCAGRGCIVALIIGAGILLPILGYMILHVAVLPH